MKEIPYNKDDGLFLEFKEYDVTLCFDFTEEFMTINIIQKMDDIFNILNITPVFKLKKRKKNGKKIS